MQHLGKQAVAFACWGAPAALFKLSTSLAQTCALTCLCIADGKAPLLPTLGCNGLLRVILCQALWGFVSSELLSIRNAWACCYLASV